MGGVFLYFRKELIAYLGGNFWCYGYTIYIVVVVVFFFGIPGLEVPHTKE